MARATITILSTVLLMKVIVFQLTLFAGSSRVCSVPKKVKNTKMNLWSGSYEEKSHLRYICEDGYKRQAGTSNLAICQFNKKTNKADWKYGNISCIRDQLIPTTTPSNTESPFTTSVSGISRVSTSSSTTVERFTTRSPTPTVKIHETPHTTQEKVTQTTQIPGRTPVTRLSTVNVPTVPGRTHSPETVQTMREQTTVSRSTTAPITENTGYTATIKESIASDFITPVQTTILTDTETSTWRKTETAAITGTVVVIILLVGVIILVVYCRKRSAEISGTQIHLQTYNPEDNAPVPDASCKESEEESFLGNTTFPDTEH